MKIVERIKKGLTGIGTFLLTIPAKVFAMEIIESPPVALYGVPSPRVVDIIWTIAKFFIIPIALLIGLIIYFKKSTSSTKKKVLITIGIITITAILYFVINKIIYEFA